MIRQLIISVNREFGSGGHAIAEISAKHFSLPLYDANLLGKIALEREVDEEMLRKYDEAPSHVLLSRTVRGYNNSPEENVAMMQFEFLQKKAKEGDPFVIVGRCSETVLKEFSALVSIFVLGDLSSKLERIKRLYKLDEKEAKRLIWQTDRKRRSYHNHYCEKKWGSSANYDICINSSRLGVEETAKVLADYVEKRRAWDSED